MTEERRIALYGGAFDPPHLGHQFTLLYLLTCMQHDEIWLVPANDHPFGKKMVPFSQRLIMCEMLIAPFAGKIKVSTVERDGDTDGRTFNTVSYLKKCNPECRFSLVVGADNIKESYRWYKWAELTKMVDLIVVGRDSYELQADTVTLPNISSTCVRQLLAAGKEPTHLIPQNILNFINNNQLYRQN